MNTVRTSSLRRLSQRLELWKLRHAATERWHDVSYRIGMVLWPRIAPYWRSALHGTTFIAVTGSCGKSTTRLLIEGAVGVRRSPKVRRGANLPIDNAHAIWTTRRSDPFAVFEVSVGKYAEKDMVKNSARLIRPHVVVVTNIRDDHISAFGSREAIAREKGDLVEALDANGVAVLNAEDPLVMGMRSRCPGRRVLTFAVNSEADVRADDVQSCWPALLSFRASHGSESAVVQTQLCGAHWASAAVAALAAAIAAGVSLRDAAIGLGAVKPFFARMEPRTRADGVTFVRDDVKAPLWTVPASLAFLGDATAQRKIAVIGTVSDYRGESRRVYVDIARQAMKVADHVIFVGAHASQALRARRNADESRLQGFNTLAAAHAYLATLRCDGALVLLKGSNEDRLDLLALERLPSNASPVAPLPMPAPPAMSDREVPFAIIGLGNDGSRYAGTRHNVGFACIDRLAERCGASFTTTEHAHIATIDHRGSTVHLVKPRAAMNGSGPAIAHVVHELHLVPDRCILVHDEVDLDIGRVRGRVAGGAGAHRGVRSVLEAFEDFRFARVKIGIGRPPAGRSLEDHVLQRFGADEQASVDRAIEAGADQALLQLNELAARVAASATAQAHAITA